MISETQLIAWLSGSLPDAERAALEAELARDPESLRRLLDQERIDAALQILHGPQARRERVKGAILSVVSGDAREAVKQNVLRRVESVAAPVKARADLPTEPIRTLPDESQTAPSQAQLRVGIKRPLFGFPAWGWMAAAACVVLLVALWFRPIEKRSARDAAPSSPPTRASVAAVEVRDPVVWPFAPDSPWNTPIGSGAVYAEVEPGGLDLRTGFYIANPRFSHPLFTAASNDPPGRIFIQDRAAPWATPPLPSALLSEAPLRRNVHLILPDGVTMLELWGAQRSGERDLVVRRASRADLRGSGIPPELASGNASGLTPLAGSTRRGELARGIPHVIGAVVPVEAVSLRPDGSAHVWPAAWSPANNPAFRARMARSGNVPLGTLLAIPPAVDITKLGVGASGPAYEVARALQDYGLYVKDAIDGDAFVEWQRAGRPHLIICVETDFAEQLPSNFKEQLGLLASHLKVVANNGPRSIGGGGAPRRPAAPAFTGSAPKER